MQGWVSGRVPGRPRSLSLLFHQRRGGRRERLDWELQREGRNGRAGQSGGQLIFYSLTTKIRSAFVGYPIVGCVIFVSFDELVLFQVLQSAVNGRTTGRVFRSLAECQKDTLPVRYDILIEEFEHGVGSFIHPRFPVSHSTARPAHSCYQLRLVSDVSCIVPYWYTTSQKTKSFGIICPSHDSQKADRRPHEKYAEPGTSGSDALWESLGRL